MYLTHKLVSTQPKTKTSTDCMFFSNSMNMLYVCDLFFPPLLMRKSHIPRGRQKSSSMPRWQLPQDQNYDNTMMFLSNSLIDERSTEQFHHVEKPSAITPPRPSAYYSQTFKRNCNGFHPQNILIAVEESLMVGQNRAQCDRSRVFFAISAKTF